MYRERRSFAPVKMGDEINVKIEAVGEKGDGIAKIKGFVIFVPNTQKDQECKVRVNKVLRKVGFGEVIGEATGPIEGSGSQEQSEESGSEEEMQEEEQQ
jgi:predicted RNA-binding protein with TRAM domain